MEKSLEYINIYVFYPKDYSPLPPHCGIGEDVHHCGPHCPFLPLYPIVAHRPHCPLAHTPCTKLMGDRGDGQSWGNSIKGVWDTGGIGLPMGHGAMGVGQVGTSYRVPLFRFHLRGYGAKRYRSVQGYGVQDIWVMGTGVWVKGCLIQTVVSKRCQVVKKMSSCQKMSNVKKSNT